MTELRVRPAPPARPVPWAPSDPRVPRVMMGLRALPVLLAPTVWWVNVDPLVRSVPPALPVHRVMSALRVRLVPSARPAQWDWQGLPAKA
jgi:hypothetical protein